VKCENCYAQLKKNSHICDYCGTPIAIDKKLINQDKENNYDEDLPESEYDEDRLSPEFRQILGTSSNRKTSSESGNSYNLEKLAFEKKPSRKWGIGQTFVEFIIYCVIFNLLEGYSDQQDVVVTIYLIWSGIRAFNFFILKRTK